MDKLKNMQVFCRIVELGTFSAVAREMNLSAMMISKYIAQLEKSLSVSLLNRTTRKLSLSEAGESYYHRCKQLLEDLSELEESTTELGSTVKGRIKISVSIDFGGLYMVPAIEAYQRMYPDVSILMSLENSYINLSDGNFDLNIRVTDALEPGVIAKKIAKTHLGTYASPAYLNEMGCPQQINDLHTHRCLHYVDTPHREYWIFSQQGQNIRIKPRWHFASNNGRVLSQAAALGMGIVQAPELSVKNYLQSGELVEILTETRLTSLAVYAIYLQRRFLPAKLTTFTDFLMQHFAGMQANGPPKSNRTI